MNQHSERLLAFYRDIGEALKNLAATYEEQQRYLRSLGSSECADELGLEFDDAFQSLGGVRSEVPDDLIQALHRLDSALAEISGPKWSNLWTINALSTRDEWKRIRSLSAEALRLLRLE